MDISTFGCFAFQSFLDTSTVAAAINIDNRLRWIFLLLVALCFLIICRDSKIVAMIKMMETSVESDNWKPDEDDDDDEEYDYDDEEEDGDDDGQCC